MQALIPYFEIPIFEWGPIVLDSWTALVLTGFVIGLEITRARAIKLGLDVRDIVDGSVVTVAMGFVVGCVIVYQVLYTDVSDHLPEYATLMAMGYRVSHLLGVVMREGFYLAALGYVPAYIAGQGLYWFVRDATKLPVGMDPARAITVLVMILVMCMLSSLLAMRRLIDADPAEIF